MMFCIPVHLQMCVYILLLKIVWVCFYASHVLRLCFMKCCVRDMRRCHTSDVCDIFRLLEEGYRGVGEERLL